jgi:hypothetical protein
MAAFRFRVSLVFRLASILQATRFGLQVFAQAANMSLPNRAPLYAARPT